ncbi:transmembrane protein, putative (macronuclear) [Tetrahymena thermophila SB210]|uniref:Transmembrane protein, putative n=1 Tax=Tetrahymena thermophila (strain SB210) TaxID=312017 RepID=Q23H22_TETTS|nr:transmembrane protein, putative [Tetrahymena thermophila SB210]EAR95825.2 transmembrane protein, putative [Tetrahymena thermophila SB210]|eukprot:XP_001016070.2 transmembrane protein, putative [Tetrahymena thermophila SB210]
MLNPQTQQCPGLRQISGNLGDIVDIQAISGTDLIATRDINGEIQILESQTLSIKYTATLNTQSISSFYVSDQLMVGFVLQRSFVVYSLRENMQIYSATASDIMQFVAVTPYVYQQGLGNQQSGQLIIATISSLQKIYLYFVQNDQIQYNIQNSYVLRNMTNPFKLTNDQALPSKVFDFVQSNQVNQTFIAFVSQSGTLISGIIHNVSNSNNTNVQYYYDNYLLTGTVQTFKYLPTINVLAIYYTSGNLCFYDTNKINIINKGNNQIVLNFQTFISNPKICISQLVPITMIKDVQSNSQTYFFFFTQTYFYVYEAQDFVNRNFKFTNYNQINLKFNPFSLSATSIFQLNNTQLFLGFQLGYVGQFNFNKSMISGNYNPSVQGNLLQTKTLTTLGYNTINYINQINDQQYLIRLNSIKISDTNKKTQNYVYDAVQNQAINLQQFSYTFLSSLESLFFSSQFSQNVTVYVNYFVINFYLKLANGKCSSTTANQSVSQIRIYCNNNGVQTLQNYTISDYSQKVIKQYVSFQAYNQKKSYFILSQYNQQFDYSTFCTTPSRLLQDNEQSEEIYLQNTTDYKKRNLQSLKSYINLIIIDSNGINIFQNEPPFQTFSSILSQSPNIFTYQNNEGTIVFIQPNYISFLYILDKSPQYTFQKYIFALQDINNEQLLSNIQIEQFQDFVFITNDDYFLLIIQTANDIKALLYNYNRSWNSQQNNKVINLIKIIDLKSLNVQNQLVGYQALYISYYNLTLIYNINWIYIFFFDKQAYQFNKIDSFYFLQSTALPYIYYSASLSTLHVFISSQLYQLDLQKYVSQQAMDPKQCLVNKYINFQPTLFQQYLNNPLSTNPSFIYDQIQLSGSLLEISFLQQYYTSRSPVYQMNMYAGINYQWNSAHFQIQSTSNTQITQNLILTTYSDSQNQNLINQFTIQGTNQINFSGYQQLMIQNAAFNTNSISQYQIPITFTCLNVQLNNIFFVQKRFTTPLMSIIVGKNFSFQSINFNFMTFYKINSLIQINSQNSLLAIKLTDINIFESSFIDTSIINSPIPIQYTIQNLHIKKNVIISTNGQVRNFINSSSYAINKLLFHHNVLQYVQFIGVQSQSSTFTASISNSMIYNNVILAGSAQQNIILDLELNQQIANSSASFLNLFISQNSVIYELFNKSQITNYFDQTEFSYTQIQEVSQQNQLQFVYIIKLQNVQNIIAENIIFQNNPSINLIFSQISSNVYISNILCSFSKQQQSTSFCIKLINHVNLNATLTNINITNYYSKNDFSLAVQSLTNFMDVQDFTVTNITFSKIQITNVNLKVDSNYQESTVFSIKSYMNANIQIDSLNISNITMNTPDLCINEFSSSLSIFAPYSNLVLTNSNFNNIDNFSQKTTILIIIKQAIIQRLFMNMNNQNNLNNPISGGQAYFRVNKLIIQDSVFKNGFAYQGAGLILSGSTSNSQFTIQNTQFYNLWSTYQGGAIQAVSIQLNSVIQIQSCKFNQIFSGTGGSIYFSSTQSNLIKIQNCIAKNTFASVDGGFLYSENGQIFIRSLYTSENDPQSTDINPQLQKKINQITNGIGPFISVYNTQIQIYDFQIQNATFLKQIPNNDPILFQITQNSQLSISGSQLQGYFSLGGLIFITSSSSATIFNTTISSSMYQNVQIKQKRMLAINSQDVSMIIVNNQGSLFLSGVKIQNNTCSDSKCVSNSIFVNTGNLEVVNSQFQYNKGSYMGGAINLINPVKNTLMINATFAFNKVSQLGGALYIQSSQGQFVSLKNCNFIQNSATIGGALYAVNQENQNNNYMNWLLINKSLFQRNLAQYYGGAYFIKSNATFEQFNNKGNQLVNNTSVLKYGNNYMSSSSRLVLDIQQMKILNQNLDIQQGKGKNQDNYIIQSYKSGATLPNLILNLLDEQGNIINKSYQETLQKEIIISINQADNNYYDFIINQQSEYYFYSTNTSFIIEQLFVIGKPGSFVWLNISSSSKNYIGRDVDQHYILLGLQIRECQEGEIFQQAIGSDDKQDTKILQKCVKCPYGTYQLIAPTLSSPIFECNKCKQNTECKGGNVILVDSGYWRSNNKTDNILQCQNQPSNCLGGYIGNKCLTGTIGPLCEACDLENKYSKAGTFQCATCNNIYINALKIVSVVIFYIFVSQLTSVGILNKIQEKYRYDPTKIIQTSQELKKKNIVVKNLTKKSWREIKKQQQLQSTYSLDASILLKIIVNYFQILVVISTFQIKIPDTITTIISVAGSPSMLISDFSQCFFQQISEQYNLDYLAVSLIGSVLMPVSCSIIFIILGQIMYCRQTYVKSVYIKTSLIYCFLYFQPSIFKQCVNLLYCREIDGIQYISYDLRFQCYTDSYWFLALKIVLPIIITVSILIPVYLAFCILKVKDSQLKIKQFTILRGEYEVQFWYWEMIKMASKLLIMSILIVYDNNIPLKATLVFLILSTYGVLLSKFRPYSLDFYNTLDIVSNKFLLFSILFGYIAYINNGNVFWYLIMSVLLVAANSIFVIWSFRYLLMAYIPAFRAKLNSRIIKFLRLGIVRCILSKKVIRRWLILSWFISFRQELYKKKMINAWSGKIKKDAQNDIHTLIIQKQNSINTPKNKLSINLDQRPSFLKQQTFDSQFYSPTNQRDTKKDLQNSQQMKQSSISKDQTNYQAINIRNLDQCNGIKMFRGKSIFGQMFDLVQSFTNRNLDDQESMDRKSNFPSELNIQINTPMSVHKLITDLQNKTSRSRQRNYGFQDEVLFIKNQEKQLKDSSDIFQEQQSKQIKESSTIDLQIDEVQNNQCVIELKNLNKQQNPLVGKFNQKYLTQITDSASQFDQEATHTESAKNSFKQKKQMKFENLFITKSQDLEKENTLKNIYERNQNAQTQGQILKIELQDMSEGQLENGKTQKGDEKIEHQNELIFNKQGELNLSPLANKMPKKNIIESYELEQITSSSNTDSSKYLQEIPSENQLDNANNINNQNIQFKEDKKLMVFTVLPKYSNRDDQQSENFSNLESQQQFSKNLIQIEQSRSLNFNDNNEYQRNQSENDVLDNLQKVNNEKINYQQQDAQSSQQVEIINEDQIDSNFSQTNEPQVGIEKSEISQIKSQLDNDNILSYDPSNTVN